MAAEAQALGGRGVGASATGGGLGAAAKSFFTPTSLKDLVTKPGAVVSLLKAIMNALKLRWPAFMGTNVLLSLGLFGMSFIYPTPSILFLSFSLLLERGVGSIKLTGSIVLLFVFWYCHKRGREVRLEREAKAASEGRVVELDDDPMVEGAARTLQNTGNLPNSTSRVEDTTHLRQRREREDLRVLGRDRRRAGRAPRG